MCSWLFIWRKPASAPSTPKRTWVRNTLRRVGRRGILSDGAPPWHRVPVCPVKDKSGPITNMGKKEVGGITRAVGLSGWRFASVGKLRVMPPLLKSMPTSGVRHVLCLSFGCLGFGARNVSRVMVCFGGMVCWCGRRPDSICSIGRHVRSSLLPLSLLIALLLLPAAMFLSLGRYPADAPDAGKPIEESPAQGEAFYFSAVLRNRETVGRSGKKWQSKNSTPDKMQRLLHVI